MCCFRSISVVFTELALRRPDRLRHNLERRGTTLRLFVITPEGGDARAARAHAQRPFDAGDRLGLAFDKRFDAAVRQVSHPAGHAFAVGDVLGEPAESDALDPPADSKSSRDLTPSPQFYQ